eukprot:jgi/Tetstr1/448586/TSEL_035835.t1
MASSPGSGASDTTVTLPPCSCRSGYSCDCDARASDRKEPEKRKYTWGKGSDEVAESDNGKVSSLIKKRTSRGCIRLMLAKEASEQSPCCSRKCEHKLYTQCGEALVDAVLDRALTVYSGNQNRSFDRLAQVLRGGYESASDNFDYMFDHGGYLRSFDHRGPIYTYDLGHVEIMPFHDGNSETFKKHLPPWMTKICVYYYYKSWAEDDNAILHLAIESEVKLASFDTFHRTWKGDFPDVTTPKVKRFSHCPICAAGKALKDQAREICTKDMTPKERQVHRQHQQLVRRQVRAEQKVHLERLRKERRDLNNAVFQSRLGHGNFFFFEIDSMDSAKTLLPHWVRIPKIVKPNMLLKYHLTCVKYDGYRSDDIYYYTNTIPHDSSTTCTLIWITIMKDIIKPHKFEFTRDAAAASGGSLRTALWSNTPLSEPVQILKSAPTGTPEIRAGRPLLYALCDKKEPDAVKVQRYLDDFKKARSYITDLAVQWYFSPVERESWRICSTAPAEARHMMATNADLNNAEAARVEAEVRAQVLEDDSAFRGVHAGAKERLHNNTSPSDAKGSNLVVIDVSDASPIVCHFCPVHEEDKCPETLGDWESRFVIGLVKSRETTEDTLTVAVYEPFHAHAKGKPLMPLWLYAQTKGGKKPVDTSWEKCLTLPWKLVEAVYLSYAKAIHDASGSREVFNEDGTMVRKKWYGKSVQVVKTYSQTGWQISQPRNNCVHVMSTTPAQRKPGGVVKFI